MLGSDFNTHFLIWTKHSTAWFLSAGLGESFWKSAKAGSRQHTFWSLNFVLITRPELNIWHILFTFTGLRLTNVNETCNVLNQMFIYIFQQSQAHYVERFMKKHEWSTHLESPCAWRRFDCTRRFCFSGKPLNTRWHPCLLLECGGLVCWTRYLHMQGFHLQQPGWKKFLACCQGCQKLFRGAGVNRAKGAFCQVLLLYFLIDISTIKTSKI